MKIAPIRDELALWRQEQVEVGLRRHIFCLPTEVLTEIFAYILPETLAIDDEVDALQFESDWMLRHERRHNHLLNVTRVCRRWRQICLSSPSLWTLLWITDDDLSPLRAELSLQRSGDVPLEVAVCDSEGRKQRFPFNISANKGFYGPLLHPLLSLSRLFPQGPSRLKTLRICSKAPPEHDFTCFTGWFDKPAPILESFVFTTDTVFLTHIGAAAFRFPSLFGGYTPALRKLSIEDVIIPWSSAIFKNLTFLRVRLCNGILQNHARESEVELNRLLEILRDCPGLVTLELGHVGPKNSTIKTDGSTYLTSASQPKVDVRFLKIIIFHDVRDAAVLLLFLDNLQTPSLHCLRIGHDGLTLHTINNLVPQTVSFDHRLKLCNCLRIDVDRACGWIDAELCLLDELNTFLLNKPQYVSLRWLRLQKSSFECRVRCDNDDNDFSGGAVNYRTVLLSLLRQMCLHPKSVRALSFRGRDSALDELPYEYIFRILTNVYCVEVRDNLDFINASGFMVFLRKEAEDTDGLEMEPALSSVGMLVFENVDFEEGYETFDDLCLFLDHRKQHDAPISYLGLNYCRKIDAVKLSILEGLVTSVCVVDEDVWQELGDTMVVPESSYGIKED